MRNVTAFEEGGGKIDVTGRLAIDSSAKLETIGAPGMVGFDATMQVGDSKTLDRVVEAIWRIAELRVR